MSLSIEDLLRRAAPMPANPDPDSQARARSRAIAALPGRAVGLGSWRRRPLVLGLAGGLLVAGGAAVAIALTGGNKPPPYVDPAALQGITPGATPSSGLADVDHYEADANAAGHAVLAFEQILKSPPTPPAQAASALSTQLAKLDAALQRARADRLSERSANQERAILVSEGGQFAASLASIVATIGQGKPITKAERSALSLYNQPFLEVALPAGPPETIARCVGACTATGTRSTGQGSASSGPPSIQKQLDMTAVVAQATIGGTTLIVAPAARVYGPWGPEYDAYLRCMAVILPNNAGMGGCGPQTAFAKYGDLEIDETRSGVHAYGYVPAGVTGVIAAGRRVPLVGRFFATPLPRGVLTVTLVTSSGARRTMLPVGIGSSG